jgi:hypothetical protein
VSERNPERQPDEIRQVPVDPEGSRPKDKTAPVSGAELRTLDEEVVVQLIQGMSNRKKAAAFKRRQKTQPGYVRARRDRFRVVFTIVAFAAILIEAGVAVYITEIAKTSSWDHVKDWLIIVMAPFIAFATLAGAFWYPTKETE